MKLIVSVFLTFVLSREHAAGNPLSTKAPKSTKAPSAMPSSAPSASDSCGNSCVDPKICMLTYQPEGVIIEEKSSVSHTPPLADGTYRICPTGSGDCEVPNGWELSGTTWGCRIPGSSYHIQESCAVAEAAGLTTYACADDSNPTALGTFETFTCPGDIRCYTSAPSIMPSQSPTKSAKATKAPTGTKSATWIPTASPTPFDSCLGTCSSPDICMQVYQQEDTIVSSPGGAISSVPLAAGTYRLCPAGNGDCKVPGGYATAGITFGCRTPGTAAHIQESCAVADAVGLKTYACANGDNPDALGTYEVIECPNSIDTRCQ